jgi:hypothetical protein
MSVTFFAERSRLTSTPLSDEVLRAVRLRAEKSYRERHSLLVRLLH